MFVLHPRESAIAASLLVVVVVACVPDETDVVRAAAPPDPDAAIPATPESAPRPPGADDSWNGEVSARIRDAAHSFVPDGDAFVAEVPNRGLAGRFDAEGAQLWLRDDTVAVRVAGFGRDTIESSMPVAPVLGACLDDMFEPGGAACAGSSTGVRA